MQDERLTQNELCQGYIRCASTFERDRMKTEMLQHVEHRLEPEMLNVALAFRVDRHPEMFGTACNEWQNGEG